MNTHKLLARLTHSDSLAPFCELCQISEDTGSEFLWRCFAFVEEHAKDEDQLFLVFTPCFFSVLESSPVDTSPLGLPVVLLRTSLSVLLGPEPLTPLHTPSLPDTIIKTLFSSPIPSLDNSSLIAKLRHLHSKAFLRAAHTALTQDLPLPPSALTDALHHCDRAQLSVNLTPLVPAVCRHTNLYLKDQLVSHSLESFTTLLEQLGAIRDSRPEICSFSSTMLDEDHSHCELKSKDITRLVVQLLETLGFLPVAGCPGLLWYCPSVSGLVAGPTEQDEEDDVRRSPSLQPEDTTGSSYTLEDSALDTSLTDAYSDASSDAPVFSPLFSSSFPLSKPTQSQLQQVTSYLGYSLNPARKIMELVSIALEETLPLCVGE